MPYSIQNLNNDLIAVLHGTTLDQITNPLALINRAARQLLLDLDPQETKVIAQIGPIFNSIYDYAAPTDLKGNGAIDIFPQVDRNYTDYFSQQFNQDFDLAKQTSLRDSFTVLFNAATKSLRINAPTLTAQTVVNNASAIGNNGTWSADGTGASNLTANNQNFQASGGSLQFNLSGTQTSGYLSNASSGSVDISSMLNQGSLFLYTYLPTGSAFSSIELRFGSSASNYYAVSVTLNQLGKAFNNGWNLLQFPWLGAIVAGSPDSTKITYLRVTYTYTGAQTGVLLNNITANLGLIMNLEYYSKYMFRSSGGIFKEQATAISDLINLDTETYNLLFNMCGYMLAQQTQGVDALFYDANYFSTEYEAGLERYKALYKSEKQIPQATYYYMPQNNYGNYINRNNGSFN